MELKNQVRFNTFFFIRKPFKIKAFKIKNIKLIILSLALIMPNGCVTMPENRNQFRDQVFSVLQMQEKQIEAQDDIRQKLEKIEKLMQELEKKLTTQIAHDNQFMALIRPEQLNCADQHSGTKVPQESRKDSELSLENMGPSATENSQKIDKILKNIVKLEDGIQNIQKKVGGGAKQEVEKAKAGKGKLSGKSEDLMPVDLYDQAFEAFENMEYQKALDMWTEMTHHFPDHKLTPNAYFWQGEACYQLQDFDNATLKYNRVIENYKKSTKYPAALLKQGLSYYALDNPADGQLRLQELLEKFPDSPEARRAELVFKKR